MLECNVVYNVKIEDENYLLECNIDCVYVEEDNYLIYSVMWIDYV